MTTQSIFIIYNTDGQPVMAIEPSTYNGPGGVQQSSDLDLFGLGYPTWGQASDQNDYRLLENFACPQSILNPSPVQPMGTTELGTGNGINAPIPGQLWYNTTASVLYVNAQQVTNGSPTGSVNWQPVSGEIVSNTQPSSPTLGQLWFNTTVSMTGITLPQLMIYNGVSWLSVAANYLPINGSASMTGALNLGNNAINNVANPVNPYDAVNLQYLNAAITGIGAGTFVPLAGGTMTGPLTMSNTNITINSGTLTINSAPAGIAITANGRITGVTTSNATDAASVTYGNTNWLVKSTTTTQSVSSPVAFSGTTTAVTAAPGTSNTHVATTAFVNPGSSLASTGYQIFPSGLILQWGIQTGNSGSQTVPFPTPFTSTCFQVVTTPVTTGGYTAGVSAVSSTGFTMLTGETGSEQIRWMAVGV